MSTPELVASAEAAVLEERPAGVIRGALGTIGARHSSSSSGWRARLATLLAIVGPGLIAMVGDNDAGAFGTYTQAGQDYGTSLLWTLVLLVPVLYVNQEMVVRLGVVSRVGHARLILTRFGRFWGAFSVIDLFLLNALTLVTEFIGISLALAYLGVPRELGILGAAGVILAAAGTGDFRRFERVSLLLVCGSLLVLPVLLWVHPPVGQVAHDLLIPGLPRTARPSELVLLIVAIVGTTVAPWQLFFQQSYLIDKRVTSRYLSYARADLWIGIALVVLGAVAMIAFAAALFGGGPLAGHFSDAGAVATALGRSFGCAAGTCFALALIDASIIGAMAVSLSTAYALGDVLSIRHSLHSRPREAKRFYALYGGLVVLAAALVLTPGTPLGLLTNAVQALAGVLLPSATVFLLLLCNDRAILGPHANGPVRNVVTGIIVAALVLLSLALTVSVVDPHLPLHGLAKLVGSGAALIAAAAVAVLWTLRRRGPSPDETRALGATPRADIAGAAADWRMAPLERLPPLRMTALTRVWMLVLRAYLVLAAGVVLVRILRLALAGPAY